MAVTKGKPTIEVFPSMETDMEDDSCYSEEEFAEWSRIVLEDECEKEGKLPDQEDGEMYYVSMMSSEMNWKFGTKKEAEKEVATRKRMDSRNQKGGLGVPSDIRGDAHWGTVIDAFDGHSPDEVEARMLDTATDFDDIPHEVYANDPDFDGMLA